MPIQVQDSFYSEAPKPVDEKMFFGAAEQRMFATKESIPSSYRFIGMIAYDTDSPYTTWQLQGGIADGNWTDITPSAPSVDTTLTPYTIVNSTPEQTIFTIPLTYEEENTLVVYNGVTLVNNPFGETNDLYTIVVGVADNTITFQFPIEDGDYLQFIKIITA